MGLLDNEPEDEDFFDTDDNPLIATRMMIKMSNEIAIEYLKGNLKNLDNKDVATGI